MNGVIAIVEDAIWAELERQQAEDEYGPYVNREINLIDGGVDVRLIARAVVKTLGLAS